MEELLSKRKSTKNVAPVDKVISKIKDMINSGLLKPGDRLPAERKMAADFGCGRTHIREALHKLEFYGIIKTLPQSGSIVNGLDIKTLDGLISDVITLPNYDFYSLVETRLVLEVNSVRLCAERWTDEDMRLMEKAHNNYVNNMNTPERVSYDFAFHRAIAEGSHNPVFKAMLLVVTPDILTIYNKEHICETDTTVINHHEKILNAIQERDGDTAAALMTEHLSGVTTFAKARLEKSKE